MIVDDHPIVRQGLIILINQEEDLRVCAEAEDAEKVWHLLDEQKPDLVILDISLKETSGFELLDNIRRHHKNLAILVLSMHDESIYAERALKAGANGYIMKQERTENLISAIRSLLKGDVYLSEKIRNKMLTRFMHSSSDQKKYALDRITNREMEVLFLIGRGYKTGQIAEKLSISTKTIESHRANIKTKLSLKNSTELAQYAFNLVQSQINY